MFFFHPTHFLGFIHHEGSICLFLGLLCWLLCVGHIFHPTNNESHKTLTDVR
jgi:hypothetical protein